MNDLWVDIDTIFRANPWGNGQAAGKKLRMAFMACFDVDQFRHFVLKSSFMSTFDVPGERAENMKTDDVEVMKLGFEWVQFFLTGQPTLAPRKGEGGPSLLFDNRRAMYVTIQKAMHGKSVSLKAQAEHGVGSEE